MAREQTREEKLRSLIEARVMENSGLIDVLNEKLRAELVVAGAFYETLRVEAAAVEREACARLIEGVAMSVREPAKGLLEVAALSIRRRRSNGPVHEARGAEAGRGDVRRHGDVDQGSAGEDD